MIKYIYKYKKNIFFSLLFSIFFSSALIYLSYFNYENNNLLNYPSHTFENNKGNFSENDIGQIIAWSKRSFYNLNIFNLGSNISDSSSLYHHFSSRGLGLFITGIFFFFTDENIYSVTCLYIFFSFANFFLINLYFLKYSKFLLALFFTSCSIYFGAKVFGGVLNPYHYFDFIIGKIQILNIISLSKYNYTELPLFFSTLKRTPNILINNFFILINFYFLLNFYQNLNKKNIYLSATVLLISTFIDPIIFLVFIFSHILINYFLRKKFTQSRLLNLHLLLIFILLLSILFHFYNYIILLGTGNEKHGLTVGFWTGDKWYAREMIYIPILFSILFRKIFFKKFFVHIVILFSILFFNETINLIDPIMSSRITNRNFEILLAIFGYSFLIHLYKNFNKIDLLKFNIIYILHLFYIYFKYPKQNFLLYLFFSLLILLIIRYKTKILFKLKFFFFILSIIFFYSLILLDRVHNINIVNYPQKEKDQKDFFNWSKKNLKKSDSLISLDYGLILNSELNLNTFVYYSIITNSSVSFSVKDIQKRINDVFYLYGFSSEDLRYYLNNYTSASELFSKENIIAYSNDYHRVNLSNLNKIIFYENFQINYDKLLPIDLLINSYYEYLQNQRYMNLNYFNKCIITDYDKKFIKKNSYMYKILQNNKNLLFQNNSISLFNCAINVN
jgi:hypothetical protein